MFHMQVHEQSPAYTDRVKGDTRSIFINKETSSTIMRITLIILLIILLPAVAAQTFSSDGGFTRTINGPVKEIIITINGSEAVNATLSLENETIWEYRAYHTNRTLPLNDTIDGRSEQGEFIFVNLSKGSLYDPIEYGNVDKDDYNDGVEGNGILGITSMNSHPTQTIIIQTNRTIHAFVPSFAQETHGYYIAEGGSSYFCNTDHTYHKIFNCNLTPQEAMVPEHLARRAVSELNGTETVIGPRAKDIINEKAPSTFTFNVTIQSGTMTINVTTVPLEPPANITYTENTTHYDVLIEPFLNLTNVSYTYGVMPEVHVIPVVAQDDTLAHTSHQQARLDSLNALPARWDTLTNHSHPLNFTFHPTTHINYSMGGTKTGFSHAIFQHIDEANYSYPAITITLDIHDYFPDRACTCQSFSPPGSHNLIAEIRLNGFSEHNNKSDFQNDTLILMNLALHEIAHAFIFYPEDEHFHGIDHPKSYSPLPHFNTSAPAESPTGTEGYFEFYSILNQVSIFTINETLTLSPLDKMLLGTLSPEKNHNYTFYEGVVTDHTDHFTANLHPNVTESANHHYDNADDLDWWDVRTANSPVTDMGTQTSFPIQKREQAVWVYAHDAGYDHFRVLPGNSSVTILQNPAPTLSISASVADNVTFICNASNQNLQNMTLSINNRTNETRQVQGTFNSSVFVRELSEGVYNWSCTACDEASCTTQNSTIDTRRMPNVTISASSGNTTTVLCNASNNNLRNISLALNGSINESRDVSGPTNASLFTLNLTEGVHRLSCIACDDHFCVTENETIDTRTYPNITTSASTNGDITFSCEASGTRNLTTISLYGDWQGWHQNETAGVNGTQNSTSFTKDLAYGTYTWACRVCDDALCAFSSNQSLTYEDDSDDQGSPQDDDDGGGGSSGGGAPPPTAQPEENETINQTTNATQPLPEPSNGTINQTQDNQTTNESAEDDEQASNLTDPYTREFNVTGRFTWNHPDLTITANATGNGYLSFHPLSLSPPGNGSVYNVSMRNVTDIDIPGTESFRLEGNWTRADITEDGIYAITERNRPPTFREEERPGLWFALISIGLIITIGAIFYILRKTHTPPPSQSKKEKSTKKKE